VPSSRLRILILWSNQHIQAYLNPAFLDNPKYDFEVVCGGEVENPSPYTAGPARLWSLRQRLERGEFDLVISSPVMHEPWPRFKGRATKFIKGVRTFTTRRIRLLDTFWTPWLVSGKVREKVPLAIVDTLDPFYVPSWDFPLVEACTLYFKQNLFHRRVNALSPLASIFGHRRVYPHAGKLRPLSGGLEHTLFPATVTPMAERDIDLLCTGTLQWSRGDKTADPMHEYTHNKIRQDIYERSVKLGERFRVHCVYQLVPREEYNRLLSRSKLVVCTESVGCETSRPYEATSYGAVALISWPYTQNYRMLQPNVHAIYFSLIGDDFERVVEESLAQPEKLARIAKDGRDYTIAYKDRRVQADYVIEETLREFAARRNGAPAATS
jgi:hypothetical protein